MAATDVQHVVRHVRAGNVVGDHLHSIVAEAPGVSSISGAEIDCGWEVAESVNGEYPVRAHHYGLSLDPATARGMCSTGLVPDAIVIDCVSMAKPGAETASRYTPMGTWAMRNSPLAAVMPRGRMRTRRLRG